MKKTIFSIAIALFAILTLSTKSNAQIFEVQNFTCTDLQVTYCGMTLSVPASSSNSTTNTCLTMPNSFSVTVPSSCGGGTVNGSLGTGPTYSVDYHYSGRISSTGCSSCPTFYFDFDYDGGLKNIVINIHL